MPRDYASWFLKRRKLCPMDSRLWIQCNAEWISDEEKRMQGFSQNLREAALASLDDGDEETVRTALSALTVVGRLDDVPRLREITVLGGSIAKDCGTAIYEIEHRTPITQ